jgi:hypothetical protein
VSSAAEVARSDLERLPVILLLVAPADVALKRSKTRTHATISELAEAEQLIMGTWGDEQRRTFQ